MTRLAKYQLYECVKCQAKYRHPIWSSISIHAPLSADNSLMRICGECGFKGKLNDWIYIKDMELLTPEEKDEKVKQLMFSLGVGIKPKQPSLIKKIANLFNRKKIKKEYEAYGDIKIIGEV